MKAKDEVSMILHPRLSSVEIKYLKARKQFFNSRSSLNKFTRKLIIHTLSLDTPERYNHLEYYILLKMKDVKYISAEFKSQIKNLYNCYVDHFGIKDIIIPEQASIIAEKYINKELADDPKARIVQDPKALSRSQIYKRNKLQRKGVSLREKAADHICYDVSHHAVISKKSNLKGSANRRNLEFNLSDEDVKKLLERKTCYYTGARFSSKSKKYLKTIDRIDNSKGYIKGNVVACTHAANTLKNILLEVQGSGACSITLNQLNKMNSKLQKDLK